MSVYSITIKSTKGVSRTDTCCHDHVISLFHPSTVLVFQPPGNLGLDKDTQRQPKEHSHGGCFLYLKEVYFPFLGTSRKAAYSSYCRLFWSQHCPQDTERGKIKEPTPPATAPLRLCGRRKQVGERRPNPRRTVEFPCPPPWDAGPCDVSTCTLYDITHTHLPLLGPLPGSKFTFKFKDTRSPLRIL